MVVVQLEGGLGNQLFQYAAGRALALRTGSELSLDIGQVHVSAYRPYRLGIFDLSARLAHKREVPFEFRQPYRSRLSRKLAGWLPRSLTPRIPGGPRVVREASHAYDERVARGVGDVYLVGYWQSPRYFEDAADTIRADLALSAERVGAPGDLVAAVSGTGTVSVHVRRGDYAAHPLISPCPATYYGLAVDALAARTALRAAYVFSDDIAWAQRELRLPVATTFVSETESGSDLADFFLMTRCRHHVIANSSFSWWAAWLGSRPDGLVVSPARWFDDLTIDVADLRPADWLVV